MGLKERYDEIYGGTDAFSGRPLRIVEDILKYRTSGAVLDIGAGRGRHTNFLAEKGFEVHANDLSPVGVEKILEAARAAGLTVHAEVGDVREGIARDYDVIISAFVLHHLRRQDALMVIREMQDHTNPGGLNVIAQFTQKSEFFTENPGTENFYAESGELRRLYDGWEMLEYREVPVGEAFVRPDGTRRKNEGAMMIARRRDV